MPRLTRFRGVDIRVAVPQDLQEIIRIERASFEHEAYSKALLDAFLQEDAFLTLVAEDDAIIAYATMYHEKKEGGVRVVSIAVLPEERNQGIAKQLMRWIERAALERGARRMSLEVGATNVAAINLYLKDGFVIKGTIPDYYGKGKDALYMEKPLRGAAKPNGDRTSDTASLEDLKRT